MGLPQIVIVCLLLCGCSSLTKIKHVESSPQRLDPFQTSEAPPIGFLVQQGNIEEAIDAIIEMKETNPLLFHTPVLHELARSTIQHALQSKEDETALLGLFALSIMHDESLLSFAEPHLLSPNPVLQLTALRIVSLFQSDTAHKMLLSGMRSDFLPIRLEAAYLIATLHVHNAHEQLEALFWKVDPEMRAFVTPLFGIEASHDSVRFLMRLIHSEDAALRLQALLALSSCELSNDECEQIDAIDDPDPRIQEILAYHFGNNSRIASVPRLREFLSSSYSNVSLAAAYAMSRLGTEEGNQTIIKQASQGNPFALYLLHDIALNPQQLLQRLAADEDRTIALNASYALLAKKNQDALVGLDALFSSSAKDLLVEPVRSEGMTLSCLKVTPSFWANYKENPYAIEIGLSQKEALLTDVWSRSENLFLPLAFRIFDQNMNDLVPRTVALLEITDSPDATTLLKAGREKIGSPFIRAFCNLALFRMTKDDTERKIYRESLFNWIKECDINELIRIRQPVPWTGEGQKSPHTLTLEERSLLLTDSLVALAMTQDRQAIDQLLYTIKEGNPSNRCVLAALLSASAR